MSSKNTQESLLGDDFYRPNPLEDCLPGFPAPPHQSTVDCKKSPKKKSLSSLRQDGRKDK